MQSCTGFAPSNGIELAYEDMGNPDDPVVLMIMGLSAQMTLWPSQFCERIAQQGFRVIRFDNRDIGLSTKMDGQRIEGSALLRLLRTELGASSKVPYTLKDMALDTKGLLDHLEIRQAHVVGASMGGMIAQTMALAEPRRVRSLASIMSTTGRRTVGWQHPSLFRNLLGRSSGREGYIRSSVTTWRIIGSPGYRQPQEATEKRAAETYERGVSLAGLTRQMAAIVTQPNREPLLRGLAVPTVVIHGLADKMVHVSGGRATAAAIPGADLLLVDQMGHDLPAALDETFTRAIRRNADRASA